MNDWAMRLVFGEWKVRGFKENKQSKCMESFRLCFDEIWSGTNNSQTDEYGGA
jgi:hypothetical protein